MAPGSTIVSTVLFGQEHVDRYRATDGAEGHEWNGTHTLLLTTTGRKSGEPRTTPLIYGREGDSYVIVASKGGSDEPPAWYRNLSAEPEVAFGGVPMRATVVDDEGERRRLWALADNVFAPYAAYRREAAAAGREIPIVQLSRTRPPAG